MGRARVTSCVDRTLSWSVDECKCYAVLQSIGSLSREMKAKVLGLRLVDTTSSPKMLLQKSLLQLIFTRVQRSSLAIITHTWRGEPGYEGIQLTDPRQDRM